MRRKRKKTRPSHSKIDKSELKFGVRKRLRDREYLDSYEHEKCSASWNGVDLCSLPCIGAHIRTGLEGGGSLKPDDDLTDGLCDGHHRDQENNPGPEWWMENVYKPQRRRAYRKWKNDQSHS